MVLIINHTQRMVTEGLITMSDYNYPIVEFYRFKHPAHLEGAEKIGKMLVEYAVTLRVEFIPEGSDSGPVKDIHFKVSKKGAPVALLVLYLGGPYLIIQ